MLRFMKRARASELRAARPWEIGLRLGGGAPRLNPLAGPHRFSVMSVRRDFWPGMAARTRLRPERLAS